MNPNRRIALQAALAGTTLLGLDRAFAQANYPNKPIRLVVPFATGGGSDFIGRFIAQRLSEPLGQPVVVDNKPGAGGMVGIEQAIRMPPDGYTLALIASSYTVNPSLYKIKFDPVADITPIIQLSQGPMVIVVPPSLGYKNLMDLVKFAKANPGKLNFASAGQGSITHMAAAYFNDVAGIQMTHVPYKGTGQALTDTIGGLTQVFFATTATTLPHVQSGKLQALAVTTSKRLPALPNAPTVQEAGVAGYDVPVWHGLIGPKGMPKAIVDRINQEARKGLQSPESVEQLKNDGVSPAGGTPDEFKAIIAKEIPLWAGVVKKAGVKVE